MSLLTGDDDLFLGRWSDLNYLGEYFLPQKKLHETKSFNFSRYIQIRLKCHIFIRMK